MYECLTKCASMMCTFEIWFEWASGFTLQSDVSTLKAKAQFWGIMFRRKPSSTTVAETDTIRKAIEGILLAFAIAWIAACQGVSAGPPVQQGSLSLGSLALTFGSVAPGVSKTLTVSATNSGNAPVSISAAAISSKYFALTSPSLPAPLAAGQSVSLTFSFTPNAAGTFFL